MRFLLFIYLLILPFTSLTSQVWFQGGEGTGVSSGEILYCSTDSDNIFSKSSSVGSGASLNDTLYCSVNANSIYYSSTSVSSGFDFSSVSLCSSNEEAPFQSTDSVSGFAFSEAYFCDENGQLSIFTSSVENSGFDFSSVDLCNTSVDRTPFRGLDGSGFKSIYEACINPVNPLPIELLSFEAIPNDDVVNLFWSTASEINNSYFIVERSEDGYYWDDILEVEGAGNSTVEIEYEDTDYDPLLGVSYYRLRQVDFDGEFTYSSIEVVNFENETQNEIIAYPNPAKDIITFVGNIDAYNIFNMIGQNVQAKVNLLSKEHGLLKLNIANLPSGVYILKTNKDQICKFNVR